MAYSDTIKTADEVVNGGILGQATAVEDALRQAAITAGVTRSEYIGYESALMNYEGRDDIEPLTERRGREVGDAFVAGNFRREGDGSGALITSPGDGNTY